ncbi:MAG: hypothetical protein AUI53_01230 [Acidobacteria bacterium 13_1_40CM_2_60_7]|nr:MAG: hypothetical protein AUI53_01230 [Acidobacteria bacterium 13_1_40CM_2_60_7]
MPQQTEQIASPLAGQNLFALRFWQIGQGNGGPSSGADSGRGLNYATFSFGQVSGGTGSSIAKNFASEYTGGDGRRTRLFGRS